MNYQPAAYSACVKLKKDSDACSAIPNFVSCMTLQISQLAAQKVLPAHLLEQVLRSSTRKYQDISAGMKLSRVRSALSNNAGTPTAHSVATPTTRKEGALAL